MSQTGSHVEFVRYTDVGLYTAIVPRHREIAAGTLRSLLCQAGIRPNDFNKL